MRGPGYKLSGDVRRTWRCPTCGNERKLHGEVTSLQCSCSQGTWMRIVAERLMEPRPLQRPSDVEQRPIDFGIEAPPPQPARPEATIIKPAVSREPEPTGLGDLQADKSESMIGPAVEPVKIAIERIEPVAPVAPDQEEWGEGIL